MTGSSNTRRKNFRPARPLGDLVSSVMDPMLKKRGFASRDIMENWAVIVPPPYNRVTCPDGLKWARGESRGDGAILFVRCAQAHHMALTHDQQRLSEAINHYFGYVLVRQVKLSAAPFMPSSDKMPHIAKEPDPQTLEQIERTVSNVRDEDVKEALKQLGLGILGKTGPSAR